MVDLSSSFFVNVYQRVYPMMFPLFCSLFVFLMFICFFPHVPRFSHIVSQYFPIFSQYFLIFSQYIPIFSQYFPIFSQYFPIFSQYFPMFVPLFRVMTLDWRLLPEPGLAGAVDWFGSRWRGNASGMWARDHPRRGRVDQKSGQGIGIYGCNFMYTQSNMI